MLVQYRLMELLQLDKGLLPTFFSIAVYFRICGASWGSASSKSTISLHYKIPSILVSNTQPKFLDIIVLLPKISKSYDHSTNRSA